MKNIDMKRLITDVMNHTWSGYILSLCITLVVSGLIGLVSPVVGYWVLVVGLILLGVGIGGYTIASLLLESTNPMISLKHTMRPEEWAQVEKGGFNPPVQEAITDERFGTGTGGIQGQRDVVSFGAYNQYAYWKMKKSLSPDSHLVTREIWVPYRDIVDMQFSNAMYISAFGGMTKFGTGIEALVDREYVNANLHKFKKGDWNVCLINVKKNPWWIHCVALLNRYQPISLKRRLDIELMPLRASGLLN